jgi:hypothetical protein
MVVGFDVVIHMISQLQVVFLLTRGVAMAVTFSAIAFLEGGTEPCSPVVVCLEAGLVTFLPVACLVEVKGISSPSACLEVGTVTFLLVAGLEGVTTIVLPAACLEAGMVMASWQVLLPWDFSPVNAGACGHFCWHR